MTEKISRNYTLNKNTYNFLLDELNKNNYNSISQTLENVITEYIELKQQVEKQEDLITHSLTRIRLASNSSEKNTQIIIEILNSILMHLDPVPYPTNILKNDVLLTAEDDISKKIKKYRTKKLDREFK